MALSLAVFTISSAAATSLGGITANSLMATTNTTRAIIAFDLFTATPGSVLHGTTTDTPSGPYATPWTNYTWVDSGGSWRVATNRARCAASNILGNLWFNTATNQMSVEATIRRSGGTYNGGVMINDDGSNAFFARVRTNTGTTSWLELNAYLVSAGGFVSLQQVSIPIATTYRVRLESYGDASSATMKVFLNGAVQFTYTLTPAQAAVAHGAGAVGVGLACFSDTTSSFDFFHVDV